MRLRKMLATTCLLLCCLLPACARQVQAPTCPPAVTRKVHTPATPVQKEQKLHPVQQKPQLHPAQQQPQHKGKVFENFPANVAAYRFVNSHRSPAADVFFAHYYWLGNGYILLPVAVLIYIFRRQKLSIFFLAILLEYLVVNLILKPIFNQPRPHDLQSMHMLAQVHILSIPHNPTPHWKSFPSGDVAQAFATAVPLMVDEKWYTQLLLFLYAVLIGYERMYVGVHFPLDVMTGALVGTLSAAAALAIIGKWRKGTVLTEEEVRG